MRILGLIVIRLLRLRSMVMLFALAAAYAFPVLAQQDATTLLLVARPHVRDPLFAQSVVLVTRHGRSRPMGVILNKPSNIRFALPSEKNQDTEPGHVLYLGGPVSPQVTIYLFRDDLPPNGGNSLLRLGGGVYLGMGREVPNSLLERKTRSDLKAFRGFASWSHGQLEQEISRGNWLVLPFDPAIALQGETSQMWNELLARASQRRI